MENNVKACISGIGYIGLPTGAVMAKHGIDVVGVDVNKSAVDALNQGKILIEEPGLDELVDEVVKNGKFRASLVPEEADVFIIAVPTPMNEDKTPNLDYVRRATEDIVPYVKLGNMVILESTSPPGTVESIMLPILKNTGLEIGKDLFIAHSPERVIPGKVLEELISNDRIIGGINKISAEKVADFYRIFVKGDIYLTDAATAEMCKLMENSFRGVNIAIANELAIIAEKLGMNAWEVISLANHHPRVNILQPGPGVGGHCIAIDPWFIVSADEDAKILKLGMETNESMPYRQFMRIKSILGSLKGKKITFLGMSFKPDIDDYRESPILKIIDMIEEVEGIKISIYDPHIKEYRHIVKTPEEAFKDSNLVCLAVQHSEFKELDYDKLFELTAEKRLFDMRNYLNHLEKEISGLEYHLLGRGVSSFEK